MNSLLSIKDLSVTFHSNGDTIPAVTSFSTSLEGGSCTAIIGESGCGKSVVAHAILQILPDTARVSGSVIFKGRDLQTLSTDDLNTIRGKEIGIIFQSPDRALNPIYRIYRQIEQPLKTHKVVLEEKRKEHIYSTLKRVGFSNPEETSLLYPCNCSGGMNQRAVTAIVLALLPELVIADEPTKGLDNDRVSDVKSCLIEVKREGRTLLLITHDITLARELSEDLLIMYAGEIVESGKTIEIMQNPMHPYTSGLLGSLPENGFVPIPGFTPSYADMPSGCRFKERCRYATGQCHQKPELVVHDGRKIRCHRYY